MDCIKAGKLISSIRKEKNMTQKEVADALNISDKTVSKWERGLGYPDISLIGDLSKVLNVDIEKLLAGDLAPNVKDSGNLRRLKFFVCKSCSNIIYSTGNPDISCCGRKLLPLTYKNQNEAHRINVEEIENDHFISLNHEMTKDHYISFIAQVSTDRVLLVKMYPEQNAEIRIAKKKNAKLYAYCTKHGLWKMDVNII